MSKKQTKSARNGKIDLIRFLCAVSIAGYHLGCSVKYENEWFMCGYMAVEFFFIVSGYLLAKSLAKVQIGNDDDYLNACVSSVWKRYLTFIPYYLVVVILTLIAWVPAFELTFEEWKIKALEAIPNILLLQMFGFKTADWFIPTWYLSAMMASIMILSPILLKKGKFYSLYISPAVSFLLLGLVYKKFGNFNVNSFSWDGIINYGMFRAFAEISLGCTAYYIVSSGYLQKLNKVVLYVIGYLCTAGLIAYIYIGREPALQFSMILLSFAAVMITFFDNDTLKFLNNGFVYLLGRLSLPVFLTHSIVRYQILDVPTLNTYGAQVSAFFMSTLLLSVVCIVIGDFINKRITVKKRK